MITQLDNDDDDDERLIDRLLVFGLFFITRCSFVFMEFLRFPAIFFYRIYIKIPHRTTQIFSWISNFCLTCSCTHHMQPSQLVGKLTAFL